MDRTRPVFLQRFDVSLRAVTLIGPESIFRIFAVIPDNDSSFNFIVGMLYTQLFQRLYSIADAKPDKMLSVPVHFVMDEFANVASLF